jgi:hypothetical protein
MEGTFLGQLYVTLWNSKKVAKKTVNGTWPPRKCKLQYTNRMHFGCSIGENIISASKGLPFEQFLYVTR